jgi:polyphenol oxidase
MTHDSEPLALRPDWQAPGRVRAFVTLRTGGVSDGSYGSLNLGDHVGDDPARVAANRARVFEKLGLPGAPHWLEQVHGRRVVDLDREDGRRADGAVTGRAGVVCAVMTADCLPVLFWERAGRRVGVAHAGWRGLAAGVLESAVEAMAVAPAELEAWLGPAISAAAYEVGDEVRAAFAPDEAAAAFERNARGRWQADLYRLARGRLQGAGVTSVHGGAFCTYREAGRFFSHRREAPCGRFASLIWIQD